MKKRSEGAAIERKKGRAPTLKKRKEGADIEKKKGVSCH